MKKANFTKQQAVAFEDARRAFNNDTYLLSQHSKTYKPWQSDWAPLNGISYQEMEKALNHGYDIDLVPRTINALVKEAHQNAVNKGWYEEPRSFGDVIALIHSELSEALEDYRDGKGFTHVCYEWKKEEQPTVYSDRQVSPEWKPCGIPSEMADVVIRVFDFCGHVGIDLEAAIREKMAYNATRPVRHGGKML